MIDSIINVDLFQVTNGQQTNHTEKIRNLVTNEVIVSIIETWKSQVRNDTQSHSQIPDIGIYTGIYIPGHDPTKYTNYTHITLGSVVERSVTATEQSSEADASNVELEIIWT